MRTIAENEGKKLVRQSDEEVKRFHKLSPTPRLKGPTPKLIVVNCDGGRVQTRNEDYDKTDDNSQWSLWKEDKIGVVYDAVPEPNSEAATYEQYQGAQAQTKTFVATMKSWNDFGPILRIEAEKRGYLDAKEKLLIADGATHIREVKRNQFSDITAMILDWPHASGHLSDSSKAYFGEGTKEARDWYQEYRTLLWKGERNQIITELKELSSQLGKPRESDPLTHPRRILHQNAYSYFPNNYDAIDYPTFRSNGWPIASGVAEGAVKQFALRMKGSEKFWNVSDTGAEEMLALCALYHSEDGRWKRYWKQRAAPYVATTA
jgi:hypothetical protein